MKKLILPFILLSSAVHAQSQPTQEDFEAISRCSLAYFILVGATEIEPNNRPSREDLIKKALKAQEALNPLRALPSTLDMVMAHVALESLLSKGIKPGDSPRMHDWFIAQVAATCAITTKRQN